MNKLNFIKLNNLDNQNQSIEMENDIDLSDNENVVRNDSIKTVKTINAQKMKNYFKKMNTIDLITEDSVNDTGITKNNDILKFILTEISNNPIKKIYEEFLSIGIEKEGLEFINDRDELILTPKILANFPNKIKESELKYNIRFLKNFCFNEGVKVNRYYISNEEDYQEKILEKNLFSTYNTPFMLLQQIAQDNILKYFIFGIKFEDLYIIQNRKENQYGVNIFTYEKTYLFISYEPLCHLFEKLFLTMLNHKKLNFQNIFNDYEALFNTDNIIEFEGNNHELNIERRKYNRNTRIF